MTFWWTTLEPLSRSNTLTLHNTSTIFAKVTLVKTIALLPGTRAAELFSPPPPQT